MYILVRGIPTKKSKIIWEEMVDVKKIFDALIWLKRNNPLYNHITRYSRWIIFKKVE